MWNSLPEDIKCKPSVSSFQKALKKLLIQENSQDDVHVSVKGTG